MSEEGGQDNGLMGYTSDAAYARKPSDGQPFKNLGPVAGAKSRAGGGSMGPDMSSGPMMMKKKMRKKMGKD